MRQVQAILRASRCVRIGKWVLWGGAISLIAALIAAGILRGQSPQGRMVYTATKVTPAGERMMEQPRYHGLDVHNQPFTISADWAREISDEVVEMQTLQSDMMTAQQRWIALSAQKGRLNRKKKTLELSGAVDLITETGYSFQTPYAWVDLAQASVQGDQTIHGQGPAGTLSAQHYRVWNNGRLMMFDGEVKVTLNMRGKNAE